MKATVAVCPPPQRLALQSAADSAVLIAVMLGCALLIAMGRAVARIPLAREVAKIQEWAHGELNRLKAEMHKEVEDLAMERDAAVDRVEALEATNAKLVERIAKLQPGAVQSYELRAKLKEMQ